jgi:hypothetical protein
MIRLGIKTRTLSEALSGSRHYAWQGGKSTTSGGYTTIYMPTHPKADKRHRVREHIVVWENTHGRKLRKGEIVHHINGLKSDNRPENLVAMLGKEHIRFIPMLQKRIQQLESELASCMQSVMQFDKPKEKIEQGVLLNA